MSMSARPQHHAAFTVVKSMITLGHHPCSPNGAKCIAKRAPDRLELPSNFFDFDFSI